MPESSNGLCWRKDTATRWYPVPTRAAGEKPVLAAAVINEPLQVAHEEVEGWPDLREQRRGQRSVVLVHGKCNGREGGLPVGGARVSTCAKGSIVSKWLFKTTPPDVQTFQNSPKQPANTAHRSQIITPHPTPPPTPTPLFYFIFQRRQNKDV